MSARPGRASLGLLDFVESNGPEAFSGEGAPVSTEGEHVGCRLIELPAGSSARPRGLPSAGGALYVVSGTGIATLGRERKRIKAGDYLLLPSGEDRLRLVSAGAHSALSYLAISTAKESGPTAVAPRDDETIPDGAPADACTSTMSGLFSVESRLAVRDADAANIYDS